MFAGSGQNTAARFEKRVAVCQLLKLLKNHSLPLVGPYGHIHRTPVKSGFEPVFTVVLGGFKSGGLAGTRTQDQRLKRPLLYRLSYQPTGRFTLVAKGGIFALTQKAPGI